MQHGFRKESELREREIENSGKDLKESGETVPKGWINRTNSLDTFWSVCFLFVGLLLFWRIQKQYDETNNACLVFRGQGVDDIFFVDNTVCLLLMFYYYSLWFLIQGSIYLSDTLSQEAATEDKTRDRVSGVFYYYCQCMREREEATAL